jgi:hypothetical protein
VVKNDDGEWALLIQHMGIGATPLPDGQLLVKVTDGETGISALSRFSPEALAGVVNNFREALGRRIVEVDDEERRRFGG